MESHKQFKCVVSGIDNSKEYERDWVTFLRPNPGTKNAVFHQILVC